MNSFAAPSTQGEELPDNLFASDEGRPALRAYDLGRSNRLPIGQEEYGTKIETLLRIDKLFLNFEYLYSAAKRNETPLPESLYSRAVEQLRTIHVEVLDKESISGVPGQPELVVYPGFASTRWADENEASDAGTTDPRNVCKCPSTKYWASLIQGGSTLRSPLDNYRVGTWGMGNQTDQCLDADKWMESAILEMVGRFVADVKAAREIVREMPPAAPSPAAVPPPVEIPPPAQEQPEPELKADPAPESAACRREWRIYLEAFTSDSISIRDSAKPILVDFARDNAQCSDRRFAIEVHADDRGDADYNMKLTEDRGAVVVSFLMAHGIREDRIEIRAHGEQDLAVRGNTPADHAANRRLHIRSLDD